MARIARGLGAHPACLAPLVTQQSVEERASRGCHTLLRE